MLLLISDEASPAAGLEESSERVALRQRGIAIYRPTVPDLTTNLAGLKKLGV